MNLALTLAYLGTRYAGFQSQSCGNGIQDILEKTIGKVLGQPVRLHGAGRTDAGVHAAGQVAHFRLPEDCSMSEANWVAAINAALPSDIRILSARILPTDFHARFDATGKQYRYMIAEMPVLSPFLCDRAWHRFPPLDLERLRAALALFVGRRDFSSFSPRRAAGERGGIREVRSVGATRLPGDLLRIDVVGDGFLYKMVRCMVGEAVRVAMRKSELGVLMDALDNPLASSMHHIAPAAGLCLMRVEYSRPDLPSPTSSPAETMFFS